jgi:hypothetical protein
MMGATSSRRVGFRSMMGLNHDLVVDHLAILAEKDDRTARWMQDV